jgi:hypothetical protein
MLFVVLMMGIGRVSAAETAADLIRIHIEALGGKDRVAALAAVRATGQTYAGGKRMRFTEIAARPDRVRLETAQGGRTLVQVTDGVHPPWEIDTAKWPPRYRDIEPSVAKTFAADAEYDDPLVAGPARGFTIETGGDMMVDGKRLIRLVVTRKLAETFMLLLDPDTYFIEKRVETRPNPLGGVSHVLTEFSDYRPVDGVLLPHRVRLIIDGKLIQETKFESIEPNPEITEETFSRPLTAVAK